jgi:hypothetical protein
MATNMAINFSGGSHQLNGVSLNGTGKAQFTGATASFTNNPDIKGNLLIN